MLAILKLSSSYYSGFFDSVPELWFLFLLFFDPASARLARIRVGVWGTSTLLVQVDVNNLNLKCKGESSKLRWNMAEIALLPRRLAERSGTPPRWCPLQLGGR